MLGYVTAYRSELKVKDSEAYKGYYCGVCKAMGKQYGQLARMTLSYDATFLAILLDSLFEDMPAFSSEVCIANPFKRKLILRTTSTNYAADIMFILAWYKLLDDIKDDKSIKAFILKCRYWFKYKKAKRKYPELCDIIDDYLSNFAELEKEKCDNLDMMAESFSKIMENIFTTGYINIANTHNILPDTETIDSLRNVGYHLGKWIYIIDAFDDIDENIQKKTYNPLFYRYNLDDKESSENFKNRIKDNVWRNLMILLEQISENLKTIKINKTLDIINNIIYIGLFEKTKSVLNYENKGE
ncbi:MAG: DUF5685 family protein [Eubacteriales bacterium]|nr:DUF5685 family protein [Eubacteriales bacterium]MDY3332397.1 DUF5685 family protein [Gallibacter sp.]